MRKINFKTKMILATIFLLLGAPNSWSHSLEMVTFYPAPMGVYDRLSLTPQSSLPMSCTIGTLMVEQATGKLYYCLDDGYGIGTWGYLSNIWTQNGNYVYPRATDTNSLISWGIGMTSSECKLSLYGGGILAMGTFGSGVTLTDLDVSRYGDIVARLIWYPRKASFRAVGDVNGQSSDNAFTGNYSVAFGVDIRATGTNSTASSYNSTASGDFSTIAGGVTEILTLGTYSTNIGGTENKIYGNYSVGAGIWSILSGDYNTISNGNQNVSAGLGNTITGGIQNVNNASDIPLGTYSTISGGAFNNLQSSNYAALGGGRVNTATAKDFITISGGDGNSIGGDYASVGGGDNNRPTGDYSTISGGSWNTSNGSWATVAGGNHLSADGNYSTVVGGYLLNATGEASTIINGSSNINGGDSSVVAAGFFNDMQRDFSTYRTANYIFGNYMNLSTDSYQYFVRGFSDTVVNITAQDAFIIAPGTDGGLPVNPHVGIGETNPSAILGITHSGSDDYLAITSQFSATPGDIFFINNAGNIGIKRSNPSYPLHFGAQANNAYLTTGGAWTTPSSRTYKEHIEPLNGHVALDTVVKLEPVTYTYKVSKNEHHVGFISEDVPELIASKGRKSIDPMTVTALLTSVLKTHKQELQDQEVLLNNLENELESLKTDWLNR